MPALAVELAEAELEVVVVVLLVVELEAVVVLLVVVLVEVVVVLVGAVPLEPMVHPVKVSAKPLSPSLDLITPTALTLS